MRSLIVILAVLSGASACNPLIGDSASSTDPAFHPGVSLTTPSPSPISVPTVSSVSPTVGVFGTTVTINGSGFKPEFTVTLAGSSCQSFTYVSSTILTCVTSQTQSLLGSQTLVIRNSAQIILSAPNVYTNLGSPLVWLKADSLTLANADPVTNWPDSSGNHNDASVVLANAPAFNANAIHSQAGLNFNGSNQYLNFGTGFSNFAQGFSFFLINNPVLSAGSQTWSRFLELGNGCNTDSLYVSRSSNSQRMHVAINAADYWAFENAIVQSQPSLNTVVQTPISAGASIGTLNASLNGVALATAYASGGSIGLPSSSVRSQNHLGKSGCPGDPNFGGVMAELILYNTALTATEQTAIELYLNQKYQIY